MEHKERSHKKSHKKKSFFVKNKSNVIFTSSVIVFLITAFILFVPTKTITYEIEVAYTDTEIYFEKEPYEVQEEYQVQEAYESTKFYTDIVPIETIESYTEYVVHDAAPGQYYTDCGSCSCTNSTPEGYCLQCTCAVTKYETEIVYEEILKERPVTEYKTATKSRTVTKYKDVEKTRDVIKTRNETNEIEVNWIWGFKMPYKLHLK